MSPHPEINQIIRFFLINHLYNVDFVDSSVEPKLIRISQQKNESN